ncbi:trypsin-like peptidase domain-containing protein [Luteococcus sp. OSA5]|uniref:trypsin-like peptidase domain-containing protein n=1 Tax=Luteococcus sp. OSA5 TaxID=3401630 RepID=UPI003B42CDC1
MTHQNPEHEQTRRIDDDGFWMHPDSEPGEGVPHESTQVLPVEHTQQIPVVDPLWGPPTGPAWQPPADASTPGDDGQAQHQLAQAQLAQAQLAQASPGHPAPQFAPPGQPPYPGGAPGPYPQRGAAPYPVGAQAGESSYGLPGTWYVDGPSAPRRAGRGARALLVVLGVGALAGAAMVGASGALSPLLPGQQPAAQQPAEGEGDGSVPAEQRPYDPWDSTDEDESDAQEEDTTPGAEPTRATSDQSRGVVLINASTGDRRGAGSGMVVSPDGLVLTNYHVVESSTRVQVKLASTGRSYEAEVLGHDATRDVALLQLDGAKDLETITFDDDELSVGDEVTAVGNANGQGYLSAAAGRVRDLDSSIVVANENTVSGKERLSDVIKTSAAAQPGDSGGPMFDDEGEVVGMTTAGQQASSGIRTQNVTVASYAVPADRAQEIIEQIREGKEEGTVRVGPKAYLGVTVKTVQDETLVVAEVVAGGPADGAGLSRGDIITSLDGTDVDEHASLSQKLAEHEPGDRIEIGWRDAQGERHSAEVELGESPMN